MPKTDRSNLMMTKTDRSKLLQKGVTILRAKINIKNKWEVVKYSSKGGLKKCKGDYDWFTTREECEKFIKALAFNDSTIVLDEFLSKAWD